MPPRRAIAGGLHAAHHQNMSLKDRLTGAGMQYFGPYWSTVKFAMAIALAVPVVVFMFGLMEAAASRNPSNGSYGSSPGAESQTAGEQAADAAAGPHKPARPARHSISETPVILPNSALCAFCGPAILPTSPRVICILFSVVLTLISSKTLENIERFKSKYHDIVVADYGRDPAKAVNCDFCVWTMQRTGVKWELLEHFLDSDWWKVHWRDYEWLWYPDDDLARTQSTDTRGCLVEPARTLGRTIFAEGDIDKFLQAATSQHTFHLVQPSLCEGSFVVHPSFAQSPNHTVNEWEHVRTAELQMPLGRVSWWHGIKEKFLRGQTLGMGMDYFWGEKLNFEQHSAVFDGVCAFHPERAEGHRTGRDCPDCHPNVPRTPEINAKNSERFGFPIEKDPRAYEKYFKRYRRIYKPLYGPKACMVACGPDTAKCLGATDVALCQGKTSPNFVVAEGWSPADDHFDDLACLQEAPPGKVCCGCLEADKLWPGPSLSSNERREKGLPAGFVAYTPPPASESFAAEDGEAAAEGAGGEGVGAASEAGGRSSKHSKKKKKGRKGVGH